MQTVLYVLGQEWFVDIRQIRFKHAQNVAPDTPHTVAAECSRLRSSLSDVHNTKKTKYNQPTIPQADQPTVTEKATNQLLDRPPQRTGRPTNKPTGQPANKPTIQLL